jgi:hypothetical protein
MELCHIYFCICDSHTQICDLWFVTFAFGLHILDHKKMLRVTKRSHNTPQLIIDKCRNFGSGSCSSKGALEGKKRPILQAFKWDGTWLHAYRAWWCEVKTERRARALSDRNRRVLRRTAIFTIRSRYIWHKGWECTRATEEGKNVKPTVMPVVTTLPFFSFFFAPSPKRRVYVLYQ